MIRTFRDLAILIFLLHLFEVASSAGEQTTQNGLLRYEIRDQFDRPHTESEFEGRCVLLVCGDRKGSSYQSQWVSTLRDSLRSAEHPESVVLVEAADLRGVPFFMKGRVKNKFPREEASWVLMDWAGHLAKAYGFEKDKCNIALFDHSGMLVHSATVEDLSEQVLEEILAHAEAAVRRVVTSRWRP